MAPIDFGTALNQLASLGFFDYVLPFLLIFALVFGILSKMKLFGENRGISAIIAMAVGLLSLQWGFVPQFFSAVFPRAGVALAIILVLIIIAGGFVDTSHSYVGYGLLTIGVVAVIVTLLNTSDALGWYSGAWVRENAFSLIFLL